MISDKQTYKKLPRDPAPSLECKMNELLLSLNCSGSIPDNLYHHLQSSAGSTPLLYGLSKIHKPGIPLRPIASFIHSPTYQLSKHLVYLLSLLVGNTTSHVRNCKDFASFISDYTIPDDHMLVSFDVVSLFPNVPVALACEVGDSRLQTDSTLEITSTDIVTLLRFCLNATFIAFRGDFFQQSFGTAMGSPVLVTVADLVMEDIEQRALSSFNTSPMFWKRCVDDTCTAICSDHLDEFLLHLNSIEPS